MNRAYRGGAEKKGWTSEDHLVVGDRATQDAVAALVEQNKGFAGEGAGFASVCTPEVNVAANCARTGPSFECRRVQNVTSYVREHRRTLLLTALRDDVVVGCVKVEHDTDDRAEVCAMTAASKSHRPVLIWIYQSDWHACCGPDRSESRDWQGAAAGGGGVRAKGRVQNCDHVRVRVPT